MNVYVLDTNMDRIKAIDSYESFIWTERYYLCGDFELKDAVSSELLSNLRKNFYLEIKDSDRMMIVEDFNITSDVEEGNKIKVTGRSLESILDRRVVWGQKTLTGNLQNGIQTLLNECIISPSKEERKIPNFIFEASDDPAITELTIEAQYTGDNLYEVIAGICKERSIGFKITINDNKQFVFKLYAGVDRSYSQSSLPYVIFSPKFENIIDSNYLESNSPLKNVALVGGEGEGTERRYTAVGDSSGLDRREMFVDARDISSDGDDGEPISNDAYISLLRQRGNEKLAENGEITAFEGQADTTGTFKFNEDFFIGDVVQIANEYGHETASRITELVRSVDESGFLVYPVFETKEEGV